MLPVDDRVGPARSQQLFVGPLTTAKEGPHPPRRGCLFASLYQLRYAVLAFADVCLLAIHHHRSDECASYASPSLLADVAQLVEQLHGKE